MPFSANTSDYSIQFILIVIFHSKRSKWISVHSTSNGYIRAQTTVAHWHRGSTNVMTAPRFIRFSFLWFAPQIHSRARTHDDLSNRGATHKLAKRRTQNIVVYSHRHNSAHSIRRKWAIQRVNLFSVFCWEKHLRTWALQLYHYGVQAQWQQTFTVHNCSQQSRADVMSRRCLFSSGQPIKIEINKFTSAAMRSQPKHRLAHFLENSKVHIRRFDGDKLLQWTQIPVASADLKCVGRNCISYAAYNALDATSLTSRQCD